MQRVCQFLRPAPCLLQQAGLDNLLVPLVFPSLKNARLPVGVHFCPIASPVRHLMAGIVSASFGSSDPITISCSLRFFLSTPFMLNSSSVSSRALLQHAYCISFVFNSRSRCVIYPPHLAPSPAACFCSRPGLSSGPRISYAISAARRPPPVCPFVFRSLAVAPSAPHWGSQPIAHHYVEQSETFLPACARRVLLGRGR